MNTTDASMEMNRDYYQYYENRLKTFDNWPTQILPNKYALAKNGFIYTGVGDKVKCFKCGIELKDWERTDEPRIEHCKWSPACDYLKMIGDIDCGLETHTNNSQHKQSGFKVGPHHFLYRY